jgi:hypothetical protein
MEHCRRRRRRWSPRNNGRAGTSNSGRHNIYMECLAQPWGENKADRYKGKLHGPQRLFSVCSWMVGRH